MQCNLMHIVQCKITVIERAKTENLKKKKEKRNKYITVEPMKIRQENKNRNTGTVKLNVREKLREIAFVQITPNVQYSDISMFFFFFFK